MGNIARSLAAVFVLISQSAEAQMSLPVAIEVGSGPGEVGLQVSPNQACIGPAALTAAPNGGVALLDVLNQKILVIDEKGHSDIPIPADLLEPSDLVATRAGYLVVGADGDIVHLMTVGTILGRTRVGHSAEEGILRFTQTSDGRLAVQSLMGALHVVEGQSLGSADVLEPGLLAHGLFNIHIPDPNSATAEGHGPLASLKSLAVNSPLRIAAARVTWAEPGKGALLAIQQSQRLPEEKTFVRLTRFNVMGIADGEAYLGPDAYRCEIVKPFTRLTTGQLVSLAISGDNAVSLREIRLMPVGSAVPEPVATATSAVLISEDTGDVLNILERLNGTPSVDKVSMGSTTVSDILKRARSALAFRWQMSPANHSRPDVLNLCSPPRAVWRRPHRLDNAKQGQEITAVPYRWGGYARTLEQVTKELAAGRLAGDVCTCRSGNCITVQAAGLDCSGFVSYAWATGNYFTTRSLPQTKISQPIAWRELAPGDILNVAGSHVRLVEAIQQGPEGRVITVIESAASPRCGGVCRSSYAETTLMTSRYRPYRRVNLVMP